MARTPTVTRESVPENERDAFDAFVADRGEVPTTGPGSVILNAPEVAQRALGLALYLPHRHLAVAADPRAGHAGGGPREQLPVHLERPCAAGSRRRPARRESSTPLRDRQDLPDPAADEAAVVDYGQQFFRTRTVSQDSFDAVVQHFGRNGATELTTLMGCYSMLAFNVNAFGVELPANITEKPLPI